MNVENKGQDELLKMIYREIQKEERGASVANARRIAEFHACHMALKKAFLGSGAQIECIEHDGFASVGTIRVIARRASIRDPEMFGAALSFASNYEIYPRTDGKFMLALMFYGMTKKTEG